MKHYIFNLFLLVLILVVSYIRFYPNNINLPVGCDEFGYLQLADAISNDQTYNEHSKRSFLPDLLTHLNNKGFSEEEYSWIIAPHAYHYNSYANQIINQYPPGTSFLVSLIPKNQRQLLFPALVIIILFFFSHFLITFRSNQLKIESIVCLLLLFILFSMISSPLLREYTSINSVALTIGLLIISGVLLTKHPSISIILIALTINIRLANAILLPPFIFYYLFKDGLPKLKEIIHKGLNIGILCFLSGFAIYGIYSYKLIGKAFASTYSQIDQRTVDYDTFFSNIEYYFNFNQSWFIINLLSVFALLFLSKKKLVPKKIVFLCIGSVVITYLFFLFHLAKTPYYPYAIAVIMIGVIIHSISNLKFWNYSIISASKIVLAVCFILIGVLNFNRYSNSKKNDISAEIKTLNTCFSNYDIVWAELRSSTIEYVTDVNSMRYNWGAEKLKVEIIRWLANNNLKQAIYLDDLPGQKDGIFSFLKNHSLKHEVIDSQCGSLIEL